MSQRFEMRAPTWAVAVTLGLSIILGLLFKGCTGLDVLGNQGVTETVSGDWIAVSFTAPRFPDEQADHSGGIDLDLVTLIDSGQQRVDVAAYDLDLDTVSAALIRAHDDGVQVRLVTDESNAGEEAVTRLRQAGIPVVARPDEGHGIMHDKFVVVDEAWVWTGSWNMTDNGTYRNNNNGVLIASRAIADDYATEFEEMFTNRFGPSSPANTPNPLVNLEGQDRPVQVEVYFAPEDGVADHLIQALSSAQSTVRFMAFQFTSEPVADALIELVGRGITVQGVVEERSADAPYSQVARLRAGGVEVFVDGNPYIMHHKVMIVDDQVVVLGSYNFTLSAEEENDENLLIVHDPEVAAAFLGEFGRVLQQAQAATP